MFDPAGDGTENDSDTELAIDGDPTTAWTTVTYASRNLGGLKDGVGLQLDLGGQQSVAASSCSSSDAAATCRCGPHARPPIPRGARPRRQTPTTRSPGTQRLAGVRGASDLITWRFAPAVSTDQVLIWLKALPPSADGYQGGVAEATLFR